MFLTHEALAAVCAGVGPFARVDHLVANQCRVAIEVNATLRAGEGALLRVPSLVQQETDLQAEATTTLRAPEGPLTSMSSPMASESSLVSEALGTIRTGKRALSAVVDAKVVCKSGGVSEGPSTVWAGGRCLIGMILGAATKICLRGKVLGALGTG